MRVKKFSRIYTRLSVRKFAYGEAKYQIRQGGKRERGRTGSKAECRQCQTLESKEEEEGEHGAAGGEATRLLYFVSRADGRDETKRMRQETRRTK